MACADPGRDQRQIEHPHEALAAAQERTRDLLAGASLDDFRRFVRAKTEQLRGCDSREVEYAVNTEDG